VLDTLAAGSSHVENFIHLPYFCKTDVKTCEESQTDSFKIKACKMLQVDPAVQVQGHSLNVV